MHLRSAIIAISIATAGGLTGCSSEAEPPLQALVVPLDGYQFPDDLRVAAGGELSFTSNDAEPHQIEIGTAGLRTEAFGADEQAELTAPDEAGTYDLVCLLHPSMTGSLDVEEP